MTETSGGVQGPPFFPDPVMHQPVGPPIPIVWAAHTPEEQSHRLAELNIWVTWLIDRYQLDRRQVPECWPRHWELVEELSALRQAWEGAYAATSRADAPLAWHEHFADARVRLSEWVARTGCGAGEHRARRSR